MQPHKMQFKKIGISDEQRKMMNTQHSREEYPYMIKRRGHSVLLFALGTMTEYRYRKKDREPKTEIFEAFTAEVFKGLTHTGETIYFAFSRNGRYCCSGNATPEYAVNLAMQRLASGLPAKQRLPSGVPTNKLRGVWYKDKKHAFFPIEMMNEVQH
ncbi:MAG: hypothetical protein FWG18_00300 [Alphaproteobacteria bacterium]|nr:hypothetical protein [Alphaproteobacteria bacterium]